MDCLGVISQRLVPSFLLFLPCLRSPLFHGVMIWSYFQEQASLCHKGTPFGKFSPASLAVTVGYSLVFLDDTQKTKTRSFLWPLLSPCLALFLHQFFHPLTCFLLPLSLPSLLLPLGLYFPPHYFLSGSFSLFLACVNNQTVVMLVFCHIKAPSWTITSLTTKERETSSLLFSSTSTSDCFTSLSSFDLVTDKSFPSLIFWCGRDELGSFLLRRVLKAREREEEDDDEIL